MVSGISIDVAENIDQNRFISELKFSPEEQQGINQQINKLVRKKLLFLVYMKIFNSLVTFLSHQRKLVATGPSWT